MCQLSDKDVVLKASAALINILNNYKVRAEIGAMGACKIVHQLLTKYGEDNAMLDGLLGMSLNLIIECFPNRRLLVELDSFLLFMKLYRAPTTNDDNKDVILNILKNLIGNGWRLMDPSNLPDVRGIIQVISFNKKILTKLNQFYPGSISGHLFHSVTLKILEVLMLFGVLVLFNLDRN